MRSLLVVIALFGLLVGCARTEEDVQRDLQRIEEYGFRLWEGELAGEPRSAKALENSDMVWFPFRQVYRGKPYHEISKWPAIAPAGKYHNGDRVQMVTFGGEALYVVVCPAEQK